MPSTGVQLASGTFVGSDIIKSLRSSLRREGLIAIEKAYSRSSISTLQCLILHLMYMEVCEEDDEFTFAWQVHTLSNNVFENDLSEFYFHVGSLSER